MTEGKQVRREIESVATFEEKQRERLLRDFQDGPAQMLASIVSALELIIPSLERDPQVVAAELDQVKKLIVEASDQVQDMILTLRPTILTTEGLEPALRAYAGQLGEEGMNIRVQAAGLERRVPANIEEAVFDVAREALRNAQQHAKPRNVWLKAACSGEELHVTVVDDGCGFRVREGGRRPPEQRRTGLHYMRERAEDIGGRLDVNSRPGQGTAVRLVVPLK